MAARVVVVTSKAAVRHVLRQRPKKSRLKRPTPVKPSAAIMAQYLKALLARFRKIVEGGVRDKLLPWLRKTARADADDPFDVLKFSGPQNFTPDRELSRIITDIRLAWGDVHAIRDISEEIADTIREDTETAFAKTMRNVLGVQVAFDDPNIADNIETWINENVELITTIPEKYFASIADTVREGFAAGTRHEDIANQIETDYLAAGEDAAMAKRRAALVARDQVSKLSGDLNETRQKSVGVERYIWRTSHDQRVRMSHRQRDGVEFEWGQSIESQLAEKGLAVDDIDGPPGEPINCRCYAEPVLTDLIGGEDED